MRNCCDFLLIRECHFHGLVDFVYCHVSSAQKNSYKVSIGDRVEVERPGEKIQRNKCLRAELVHIMCVFMFMPVAGHLV